MNLGCDCSLITPLLPDLLNPLNMVTVAAVRWTILGEELIKPNMDFFPISAEPALTIVTMFV